MDMNKAFFLRKEDRNPQWRVLNAEGQVLGRLATQIVTIIRGKDQAMFTNHTDSGDYVVVINAEKIVLTGNKWDGKVYQSHSGWIGGLKEVTAKELFQKDPAELIRLAIKRMMPKNRLSRQILRKVRIVVGAEHAHTAQVRVN